MCIRDRFYSCRSGWDFPVGSPQPCKIQLFKNSTSPHLPLKNTSDLPISFDGSNVSPVNKIIILGLNINSKLSWKPHICMVAKVASKKLGVLFRLREFFFLWTGTP